MRSAVLMAAIASTAVAAWSPEHGPEHTGTWASEAANATSWTTEEHATWTTYCSQSTEITHAGWTYTATGPGWVTITNAPVTVSKPVWTSVGTAGWASKSNGTWTASHSGSWAAPSSSAWTSTAPIATATHNAGSKLTVAGAGIVAGLGFLAAL